MKSVKKDRTLGDYIPKPLPQEKPESYTFQLDDNDVSLGAIVKETIKNTKQQINQKKRDNNMKNLTNKSISIKTLLLIILTAAISATVAIWVDSKVDDYIQSQVNLKSMVVELPKK